MDWFFNCIKKFLYFCVGLIIAGMIIIGGIVVSNKYLGMKIVADQVKSEPIKLHTPARNALVL